MHSVLFYFWIHWISNTYSKPNRNYLQPPQSIARVGNVTNIELHVKPFTTTVLNKFNQPIANLTIRALEYNGTTQYIGPTIHAHPGDLINVTLINDLEGVGRMSEIDKYLNISVTERNYQSYKDPDVTNIHVHGLHVDPNIDDISLYVSPKCSKLINQTYWNQLDCYVNQSATPHVVNAQNYPYRIPYDHYPGTHWYHAHRHGSVTFDIMSGIYGLFIIDDIDYVPPMIDIELLISFTWLHGGDFCRHRISKDMKRKIGSPCIGTGKDNRPRTLAGDGYVTYPFNFPIQSACFINCRMQHEIKTSFTLDDGTHWTQLNASSIGIYPVDLNANIVKDDGGVDGKQYFIVNGQIQPYIHINASNWYHFRIVNTVMNYLLFWVANETTFKNCEFKVMGRDGVYFKKPRDLYKVPYVNRKVVIQPGSRADVAVRCNCPDVLALDGEYCDYPIWASSTFNVPDGDGISGADGFAPVPEYDIPLIILSVKKPDTALFGNETVFSVFDNWTPQSYDGTPYLTDTTGDDVEADSFCASGDFENMNQCNIVHGRTKYPSGFCGKFFNASTILGPMKYKKGAVCGQVAMNQVQFHSTKKLSKVCTGNQTHYRTHEWMVTSNFHPFHHHTWPFQVQRNVTRGFLAVTGDWRDTLGAAGTFRARSNYQIDDFSYDGYNFTNGELIMHCHYVPHEDHGMMQQVELIANCSEIEGKYIIPQIDTVIIDTNNQQPDYDNCIERHATSWIYMFDAASFVGIEVSITKDCYIQFKMIINPRSITIGNLWFGIAINNVNFDKTDPDINNTNNANWKGDMNGNALIINILADGHNNPLAKIDWQEVLLDGTLRTTKQYTNKCFKCDNFTNFDGTFGFSCKRPFSSACNNNAFSELKQGSKFFSYAYGEGNFQENITYHASRGGCAFSFNDILFCNISQNRLVFNYHEGEPIITTTQFFTTQLEDATSTQEDDVDIAIHLSYYVSIIVGIVFVVTIK
eukprot:422224_1